MNDIIFNFLPAQGATIPIWVPYLGGIPINAFFPPMAGSFFGVIGGFAANYLYQRHNTHQERTRYKNMIKSEIELCINILEQDRVQLLPIDRWSSAVNSGALKLFEVGIELDTLSQVYQSIKIIIILS